VVPRGDFRNLVAPIKAIGERGSVLDNLVYAHPRKAGFDRGNVGVAVVPRAGPQFRVIDEP
jgi:hypothetical protein